MSKNKILVEIEVPKDWIDFCLSADVFARTCLGYWAFGIESNKKRGWLIFNQEEAPEPMYRSLRNPRETEARHAWRRGAKLPPYFFQLDLDTINRAYVEGCKRWGHGWYEDANTDGSRYDIAIQLALFGDIKYG